MLFPNAVIAGSFRKHWPAILTALLVGIFLVLPALVAKFRYGISFNNPVNIRADDEYFYFARIREVLDGHPTIGNAYLWEHKTKPPAPLFLGEWLVAQPLKLFGAGVVAGDVFYDFILPVVSVLLTYICFYLLTGTRWLSLAGTAFLFLGLFPTEFGRAISPQLNFIFWLSQFILTYLIIRDSHPKILPKKLIILGGANFGLLFYLYPYYWSFYLILFAILITVFLYQKHFRLAASLAAISVGGMVLAIPYFWTAWKAFKLAEYAETLRRINMLDTYFPSGLAIVVPGALLILAAAVLFKKSLLPKDATNIYLASGVVAAIAAANQHVITGRNFEFSSHFLMLAWFWFVLFAAYGIYCFARQGAIKIFFARILIISAVLIFSLPYLSSRMAMPPPDGGKAAGGRRDLPVLKWLSEHTEKDSVVYSPSSLSILIPIYTGNNVFFAAPVRLFFIPDSEVLDRFILANYYRDFSDDFVRENERSIFGVYYINRAAHAVQENKARRLFGFTPRPVPVLPEKAVRQVQDRARELKSGSFERELKKYRLDYVIWDRGGPDFEKLARLPFLEKIGDEGEFDIFRVK